MRTLGEVDEGRKRDENEDQGEEATDCVFMAVVAAGVRSGRACFEEEERGVRHETG